MSRSFALRLLESFFRRWVLCLLPLLALMSLGVLAVLGSSDAFRSSGVLYVENETLLSKLNAVDSNTSTGYQTPAGAAAQKLNDLMQTDGFFDQVLDGAGLKDFAASGTASRDELRRSVSVFAQGTNTVRAVGNYADASIAFHLADSTLRSFIEWVIDANLRDSEAAETFLNAQAATYSEALEKARSSLRDYVATRPEPLTGQTRPLAQSIEIDRLTADVTAAEVRYNATIAKAEDARLASAQTQSDVEGRFRLLDKPEMPLTPSSSLTKSILKVTLFTILGLLLTAAVTFMGAVVDHSLRQPAEVTERLGVPLIAVLPESSGVVRRLGQRERE